MDTKNNYLKYIAIALVVVFLITGALVFIKIWDAAQGKFTTENPEDSVLSYKGEEYILNDEIETFLVLGLDKYSGKSVSDSHGSGVQADFLMLLVLDNENKQSTAIQINRDTMVNINKLGIGGVKTESLYKQIALSYDYVTDDNDKMRCGNVKTSVEELLGGVKIDHYVALTMDAVSAINDIVGGVELTVLEDFTSIDESLVAGEKVTLNGKQALEYVRVRYGLEDSTNKSRMQRQQQYINALYEKSVSLVQSDDTFIVRLADALDEHIVFDSSNSRMKKYAEKFDEYEFLGIKNIEGETEIGEEFIEFYPDEESLKEIVIDLLYIPKEQQK
ncbi:MAG: hypothetical protein E7621_01100 [Ruminococcaceae bacterium]|nr:hypothetical protein [Oscillospiraceae bacterium]